MLFCRWCWPLNTATEFHRERALQWLFLRQQLYRAGWWVLVSALAWTVAFSGIMGQFLIGAVAGAVTGIALELLLRYPSLMKAG